MYRDYYATLAQVLPVLLLAMLWDSGFLHRLRAEPRRPRRDDPAGVRFWTKPRVRVYFLFVSTILVLGTGAAMLVLAGLLPDSVVLRGVLTGGVVVALATLLTRISADTLAATGDDPPSDGP